MHRKLLPINFFPLKKREAWWGREGRVSLLPQPEQLHCAAEVFWHCGLSERCLCGVSVHGSYFRFVTSVRLA